jgi:cell division protein FtsB
MKKTTVATSLFLFSVWLLSGLIYFVLAEAVVHASLHKEMQQAEDQRIQLRKESERLQLQIIAHLDSLEAAVKK